MRQVVWKVTKEKYDELKKLTPKELKQWVDKTADPYLSYGCGIYSQSLVEDAGEYTVRLLVGENCD